MIAWWEKDVQLSMKIGQMIIVYSQMDHVCILSQTMIFKRFTSHPPTQVTASYGNKTEIHLTQQWHPIPASILVDHVL